jgi:hypothetical protein
MRIMETRFASDPASQYCRVRNQARTSWAAPGTKASSLGSRRSIAICCAPGAPPVLFVLPRSFFSSAIGPLSDPSMR